MSVKSFLHLSVAIGKTTVDKYREKKYERTSYCREIKELKDMTLSKRCFIIGNGPSLTIADLNSLENEDCFACNRIYGLYEKTKWRPKYYCVQDKKVLYQIRDDLDYAINNCEKAFLPYNYRNSYPRELLLNQKVHLFYHPYYSTYSEDGTYPEGITPFAEDISKGIYDGLSITYGMIQIAAYLGYQEIYLIGVDHNYTIKDGIVDNSKSYADGIKPIDMRTQYPPSLLLCENSFRGARRYCEKHGIIIKNATRGGKLEVFERTSLDALMGGENNDYD